VAQAASEAAYSAAARGAVQRHLARRGGRAASRALLPAAQAFLDAVPLPFLGLVLPVRAGASRSSAPCCQQQN